MKMGAAILAVIGLAILTSPASAYWTGEITERPRHVPKQHWTHPTAHYARTHTVRYARHTGRGGNVSGICWEAARKGGPCGCEAAKIAFGSPIRELWLVANWLQFPRTSAHVGAAAIWGRHHVEIVTAVNGDGTVNTTGSVGFSHVSTRRLTFVEPSGAVRHRRYARA